MKDEKLRLKRELPGRFTEDVARRLAQGLNISRHPVEVESIEIGEDPFLEKVEVCLRVSVKDPQSSVSQGPRIYFTFTSELSIEENIDELSEFVAARLKEATKPPTTGARTKAHRKASAHNAD